MASVPLVRAPLGRRIALWVAEIVVALGVLPIEAEEALGDGQPAGD